MNIKNLEKTLSENEYPGRGIVIGKSEDGKYAVSAYWIMGRSENSRNRVFVEDGEGLRTPAFDESKMEDPHLIIYWPVRVLGNKTIVTNGDQTDTINDGMKAGKTFEESLRVREFEDDKPNYTPRISGIMEIEKGVYSYQMSILKSDDGDGDRCERFTYAYENPKAGEIWHHFKNHDYQIIAIATHTETREKLKVGVPMKSAVSVYPGTVPVMGVGQSASFLKNKQVDIGYRIFSLLDYKQLHFIDGRDKRAYFTNGAFDGSAIFDRNSDTMLVAGENGLLYTVYLNSNFKHEEKSLSISPSVDSHKSIAKGQNKKLVGKESSVAMLGNYAFVADAAGLLQCIDVNLMQTVWASKLEDNIDATIAVDTTDDGKAYLYVANTIQNVKNRDSITVYKIDALSGEKIWSKNFGVEKDNKIITGALASPVIGKGVLEDYVYFTIADSKESAITVALSKEDGGQVWKKRLNAYAISSPIAIYQDQSAWIVQGDSAGNLYLLNALDGEEKDVLKLDGAIESSPAAYKGNIVVGTTGGKSNSLIYCITIQ